MAATHIWALEQSFRNVKPIHGSAAASDFQGFHHISLRKKIFVQQKQHLDKSCACCSVNDGWERDCKASCLMSCSYSSPASEEEEKGIKVLAIDQRFECKTTTQQLDRNMPVKK